MRHGWLALVLIAGTGLGVLVSSVSNAQQQAPPSNKERGAQALLTVEMRGGQKPLTDNVKGVIMEFDPPKAMALIITGAKGRGQFTCELRAKDRDVLFDIQRTILFAKDVNVSCANGVPSHRGGVIIDLDDPTGGAFVLGSSR
jgi:hypothetical protein